MDEGWQDRGIEPPYVGCYRGGRPLAHDGVERPSVSEKANGPGANVFAGVPKLCEEKWFVRTPDAVEGPEGAELHDDISLLLKQLAQLFFGGAEFAAGFGAGGQFKARLTREPFVRVRVQSHQFGCGELAYVEGRARRPSPVRDFVNAAAGA